MCTASCFITQKFNVTCSSTPFNVWHQCIYKISHTESMISLVITFGGAQHPSPKYLYPCWVCLSIPLLVPQIHRITRIPLSLTPHHDQIVHHSIFWFQNHQGKLLSLADVFLLWLPLILSLILCFHAQRF